MPSRHYRKKLREAQSETRSTYLDSSNLIVPVLTSLSRVMPQSPAVITLDKLEQTERIIFALEFSQTIISFYNTAYDRILYLLDLIINKTNIYIIVDYALSLRKYVSEQIELFKRVPGNSMKGELDIFQGIILSIIENIITGSELRMVISRIEALQALILKYKTESEN